MGKKPKPTKVNEFYGLLFFLFGAFFLLALFFYHPQDHSFYTTSPVPVSENPTGPVGVFLGHYALLLLGSSAYGVSALFLFWAFSYFVQRAPNRKIIKTFGFCFFLTSLSGVFAWAAAAAQKTVWGGLIGYFIDRQLEIIFGKAGTAILLVAFLFLSILLTTDYFIFPLVSGAVSAVYKFLSQIVGFAKKSFRLLVSAVEEISQAVAAVFKRFPFPEKKSAGKLKALKIKENKAEPAKDKSVPAAKREMPEITVKVKKYEPSLTSVKRKENTPAENNTRTQRKPEPVSAKDEMPLAVSPKEGTVAYKLPLLDILSTPEKGNQDSDEELKLRAKTVEDTLRDFQIEARVVEIEQGPSVTRYELMPSPGVKVSKIVNLADDIALSLKARDIRIEAPIPGKGTIGIEIPNTIIDKVFLREMLEGHSPEEKKAILPLFLGKDTSGKTLVADLADMPHLLIAGATGSGKTVCVNAIICGLLYKRTPEQLRLVMIDPKMVELAVYNHLPHMLCPVVTDVKKAALTLNWVVNEMEKRYRILADVGVRNINSYNNRDRSDEAGNYPESLPYIVVIIDELADLMMTAQDKVETVIARLAQLARAVGIHLILATQRPSVDVITGVIKANFPARISFKVASKVDSRTVLDANGADKLIGKGDMLFLQPGEPKPIRGQGALVTDQEVNDITRSIRSQRPPQYIEDLNQLQKQSSLPMEFDKDEVYEDAVRVVLELRQASTSVLQRRLRLGYGRAARILDMMEQEGIVGPPQGTKPREILVDQFTANE